MKVTLLIYKGKAFSRMMTLKELKHTMAYLKELYLRKSMTLDDISREFGFTGIRNGKTELVCSRPEARYSFREPKTVYINCESVRIGSDKYLI